MANNINTNFASKLFAYIEHGVDISDSLKSVYRNSMIFIGDEQQIYLPKYEAYIGVGMTAYNSTIERIDAIETEIANFIDDIGSYTVKGIHVQWANDNINKPASGSHVNSDFQMLSGELTLAAIDDFNPDTGFAYRGSQYSYVPGHYENNTWVAGSWHRYGSENTSQAFVNASSGISLTYYYETETRTTPDGLTVQRPVKNRIVIDDKKTWSYMTSAYNYSLQFSRDYTNEKIETLYHDILGIGESVLVPVTYSSMFNGEPSAQTFVSDNYYYWTGSGDPKFGPLTVNGSGNITSPSGWTKTTTVPAANSTNTYYTLSTTYNNTYNTSIADGIQTLKEVAYILDILSDGTLGSVSYLDKDTWDAKRTQAGKAAGIEHFNVGSPTQYSYHRIYVNIGTPNAAPTTNETTYAYVVTLQNADNLGIQMAYSIAGNSAGISDLHKHAEMLETGQNTVRSAKSTSVNGELVTTTQIKNSNTATPQTTDVGSSVPSDFLTGDILTFTRLNVASTYMTYNDTIAITSGTASILKSNNNTNYDISRIGVFEAVNWFDHINEEKPAANTGYYVIGTDNKLHCSGTDYANLTPFWPENEKEALEWSNDPSHARIYWLDPEAQSNSYLYSNNSFKEVDDNYISTHNDATIYTYYAKTTNGKTKNLFVEKTASTTGTVGGVTYYGNYIKLDESTDISYVLHATVDSANHIATTAWTEAYVKDTRGTLTDKIDDVLTDAKGYVDQQIDALDNNTKYSYTEFYTYWATHNGSSAPVGTTSYNEAKATAFANWVNWLNSTSWNLYGSDAVNASYATYKNEWMSGAYTYNTSRSQYVSNIIEDNGVVSIEGKELPTDELQISYSMWNSQRNGVKYQQLVIDQQSASSTTTPASQFTYSLFKAIYNNDGTHKTLYMKDSNDTFVKCAPVATNSNWAGTPANAYFILNSDGMFEQASDKVKRAFKHSDTGSIYYKTLYQKTNAYCEVKLDSISITDNGIASCKILTDNGESPVAITYTLADNKYTTNCYLLSAATEETNKVQYISGTVQHYAYNNEGGVGQNRISLDVNITRIEDATYNNSGFADAYDVRDFIENMFTWVNISASVSTEQLSGTDAFYKYHSVETKTRSNYNDSTANNNAKSITRQAIQNANTLYHKVGSTWKVVASTVATPDTSSTATDGIYYASGYSIAVLGRNSSNQIIAASASAVAGSLFAAITYSSGSKLCLTYTTNQVAGMNPLNMTLTKIGQ